MKKFKIIGYVFLIFILILAIAFGVYKVMARNGNKEKQMQDKAKSEIEYLDSKFISLFNYMNNIQFEDYKISVTEIKSSDSSSSSQGGESGGSSEGSGGSSGGTGGDSSEGGQGGSAGDSGSSEQGGTSGQTGKSKQAKKYVLENVGVLTESKDVDWNQVKNEVEDMYLSLPTITLDLYQTQISQDDILKFNSEFDNLTQSIKNEDKLQTLKQLTKAHEIIGKFQEVCLEDDVKKVVAKAKVHVLKAYSLLDESDWNTITDELKAATDEFSTLLTQNKVPQEKQYVVNKGYIMLNELQKGAEKKDTEIFLIKYKNLLEELNNM